MSPVLLGFHMPICTSGAHQLPYYPTHERDRSLIMAITIGVTFHLTVSREYTGLSLKQSTCSSKCKLVEILIWIFTWLHIIMLRRWWDPWWRRLSVAHKKYLSHRILTATNTADLIPRKTLIKDDLLVGLSCSRDLQFLQVSENPSFSWTHSCPNDRVLASRIWPGLMCSTLRPGP